MTFRRSAFVGFLNGILAFTTSAWGQVEMEWVLIVDPGNTGEQCGQWAGGGGPDAICGAVDYEYWIGKHEVTNGQYIEFLNAVAAVDDTYGLYEIEDPGGQGGMDGPYGGIERLGGLGDYSYQSNAGDTTWLNKPVHFISFYDALRFANWMHNGQPSGLQDDTTTEDGAYDMSLGAKVMRKPGARVFLPSENEWYKAAYYKGGGTSAGYWDFATQSNTPPIPEPPPGGHEPPHSANYRQEIPCPYCATDVGAYTFSRSPYGAFDQNGNVSEWNEALMGSGRGLRGGNFNSYEVMTPEYRSPYPPGPEYEFFHIGFRVAGIVDCNGNDIPDACDLDCGPAGGDCDVPGCGQSEDINGTGIPDECEPPIPTISEWGLVVMALLLLAAGTVVLGNLHYRSRAYDI